MGLRFQKRIRIVKGITLNLSKSGVSLTLGEGGESINIGSSKVTGNIGLPGTGLSWRERLDNKTGNGIGRLAFWILIAGLLAYYLLRHH